MSRQLGIRVTQEQLDRIVFCLDRVAEQSRLSTQTQDDPLTQQANLAFAEVLDADAEHLETTRVELKP